MMMVIFGVRKVHRVSLPAAAQEQALTGQVVKGAVEGDHVQIQTSPYFVDIQWALGGRKGF